MVGRKEENSAFPFPCLRGPAPGGGRGGGGPGGVVWGGGGGGGGRPSCVGTKAIAQPHQVSLTSPAARPEDPRLPAPSLPGPPVPRGHRHLSSARCSFESAPQNLALRNIFPLSPSSSRNGGQNESCARDNASRRTRARGRAITLPAAINSAFTRAQTFVSLLASRLPRFWTKVSN